MASPLEKLKRPGRSPLLGLKRPGENPLLGLKRPGENPLLGLKRPAENPLLGLGRPSQLPEIDQARPSPKTMKGQPARVLRVLDGDTVALQTPEGIVRVRVSGIDAPELGSVRADRARKLIEDQIQGKEVRFAPALIGDSKDDYGRIVGHLYAGDDDVAQLVREADLEKRGPRERSTEAILANMGLSTVVGLGGAAVGGLVGGPPGAALGFALGDLGAGWAGREFGAYVDEDDSVFGDTDDDGYSMEDFWENNSPTDILMDAAIPFIFRGAGRLVAAGASGIKGAFSRARLPDTAAPSIKEATAPLREQLEAARHEVENILEYTSERHVGDVLPDSSASEGGDFVRRLRDTVVTFGRPMAVTPWKHMAKSDSPLAQQASIIMQVQDALNRRVRTLGAWKAQHEVIEKGLSDLAKRQGHKVTRKQRRAIQKVLKTKAHAQLSKTEDPIPELIDLASAHQDFTEEFWAVKEMLGARQMEVSGDDLGNLVKIKKQDDYVMSILTPRVKRQLEALPDSKIKDWLLTRGLENQQAARISAALAGGRSTPRGMYGFSRRYDPVTREPVLPESLYEQNFSVITENMLSRDSVEIANLATWGTARPSIRGVQQGADVVALSEADPVKVPPLAKAMVDRFKEAGDFTNAELFSRWLKESFAPDASPTRRAMGAFRTAAANTMLTRAFVVQLGEISRGTAFAKGGPKAIRVGQQVMKNLDSARGRLSYTSGAHESSLDEMLSRSYTDAIAGQSFHPANLARSTDSAARIMSTGAAIGTVQLIAKEAGETLAAASKAGSDGAVKFGGDLLQEISEVFPSRGIREEQLEQTAKWIGETYNNAPVVNGVRNLGDRIYEEGVQNFVRTVHFTTGSGMLANAARTPIGATALQFRSFSIQAASHFKDSVLKPIIRGGKTGDVKLVHLGLSRLVRIYGHMAAPATLAMVARDLLKGDLGEADLNQMSQKAVREISVGAMGWPGGVLTGGLSRELQLFPGLQQLSNTGGDLTRWPPDAKTLRGISTLVGVRNPRAKLLLDPLVGLAQQD